MTSKADLTDTQKRKLALPKPKVCGLCNRREQKSCPHYPVRKHLCHGACDLAEHRTAAVRPTQKSFLTDFTNALLNKNPTTLPRWSDYKPTRVCSTRLGFVKPRSPASLVVRDDAP